MSENTNQSNHREANLELKVFSLASSFLFAFFIIKIVKLLTIFHWISN